MTKSQLTDYFTAACKQGAKQGTEFIRDAVLQLHREPESLSANKKVERRYRLLHEFARDMHRTTTGTSSQLGALEIIDYVRVIKDSGRYDETIAQNIYDAFKFAGHAYIRQVAEQPDYVLPISATTVADRRTRVAARATSKSTAPTSAAGTSPA